MNKFIENLRKELIDNADEKTKLSGERFFKEAVTMYGIKSATVIKIGENHFKTITDKNKSNIFLLCDEL
jgi:3-methyladenine DNA glycosylase AlkD